MMDLESMNEGCLVSVALRQGAAPDNCCIGRLKKIERKRGIRVNPAKWDKLNGIRISREDVYIPWMNIRSVFVCTD